MHGKRGSCPAWSTTAAPTQLHRRSIISAIEVPSSANVCAARMWPKLVFQMTDGMAASACTTVSASAIMPDSSASQPSITSAAISVLQRAISKQCLSISVVAAPRASFIAAGAMRIRKRDAPKIENRAATKRPRINATASPASVRLNDGHPGTATARL
jgi:hypothetical protein